MVNYIIEALKLLKSWIYVNFWHKALPNLPYFHFLLSIKIALIIKNLKCFITLMEPDFQIAYFPWKPIILKRALKNVHSPVHDASFDTLKAKIGCLFAPKSKFELPWELYSCLLVNFETKRPKKLWTPFLEWINAHFLL